MDPLSVSASAIAVVSACAATVSIIQKTIETVKGAKRELLSVVNEIELTRKLSDLLRALTHQLGAKNIPIFIEFDNTECKSILSELRDLVKKLSEAGRYVGLQFLVKKSKFEALAVRMRTQAEIIKTVLLSITTESAVFNRQFVQTLVDGADSKAVSMSSVISSSINPSGGLSMAPIDDEKPPQYVERSSEKAEAVEKLSPESQPDPKKPLTLEANAGPHHLDEDEDVVSVTDSDTLSKHTILQPADIGSNTSLPDAKGDGSITYTPTETRTSMKGQKMHISDTAASYMSKFPSRTAVWHGQLSRAFYDAKELTLRDELAYAAYYGCWDEVEDIIDEALDRGLRSWPNCHRLGNSNLVAGWTPLHQAAFLSAPRYIVKMLVDRGASRTLKTLWTNPLELPYRNMTALEIARSLGSKHLFDVLSPVVRHHVPYSTLCRIQENFHDLIRDDLANRPEYSRLRLPELELLSELENPEMFFPLESQKTAMGYFNRLDGRELVVAGLGVLSSESQVYYRITERSIREIEDAILFDVT